MVVPSFLATLFAQDSLSSPAQAQSDQTVSRSTQLSSAPHLVQANPDVVHFMSSGDVTQ
jgi:hypothetical protein